jgi:hypothetical protein
MVMELVVRTSSATNVEMVTTLVIVPWLIDTTNDMTTLLRFHHMYMDAKLEIVHAIYHQLLTRQSTPIHCLYCHFGQAPMDH